VAGSRSSCPCGAVETPGSIAVHAGDHGLLGCSQTPQDFLGYATSQGYSPKSGGGTGDSFFRGFVPSVTY